MLARAVRPGARSRLRLSSRHVARPLVPTASLAGSSLPVPYLRLTSVTASPPSRRCYTTEPPPVTTSDPGQEEEYIPNTSIRVLRTIAQVRAWHARRDADRPTSKDPGLALVPTMGALHEGHTALLRAAAQSGHHSILVSIYVNPAQFGVADDLDTYPKTWEGDCAVLAQLCPHLQQHLRDHGGDGDALHLAVFAPPTAEMYPSGPPGQTPDAAGSFVTITPVGARLEGATRPTFFRGVATVCMKLLHIAQPSRVFLGQKDVQQTVVLRAMVRDFCVPAAVAVVPTVRDARDGLALSSRNVYLGARRRAVAPVLIQALRAAERAYLAGGATAAREIVPVARQVLGEVLGEQKERSPAQSVLFEMDYLSLADPDTMEELEEVDPAKGAILSGAIQMLPVSEGQDGEDLGLNNGPPVRLIDNLILPPRKQAAGS